MPDICFLLKLIKGDITPADLLSEVLCEDLNVANRFAQLYTYQGRDPNDELFNPFKIAYKNVKNIIRTFRYTNLLR